LEFIQNPYRMFRKFYYDDSEETFESITEKDYSEYENTYVKVVIQKKTNPFWFDTVLDKLYTANVANLVVVENFSDLEFMEDDEIIDEAQDTLTILSKYVESLNVENKTELNSLMTDILGYKTYLAQGGDFGGTIATWLAYDFPKKLAGIHINILITRHPDGPQTQEEKEWQERFKKEQRIEDGYRTQQATKPQTLSYAMMDSPVGVAAWIIEKMRGWSDIKDNDIESVYSKDTLLSNIMVYLVTKTFNTASWIYYGRREEGGRFLPKEDLPLKVPTAVALFPKEYLEWAPRSYVERIYNIQRWTEMPKGGHFAALEQPDLLVKDIRDFAKSL